MDSVLSQTQLFLFAVKQLAIELVFQGLDGLADHAGADRKGVGGAMDVLEPGGGGEIA